MEIWTVLYSAFIACIIYYLLKGLFIIIPFIHKTFKIKTALKQFPAEPYHWLFGHLNVFPGLNSEGIQMGLSWVKKYPRYYVFHVGPFRSALILNHPDTIKQIMKTSEPKAFAGGGGYTLLRPWIGDGLLLSSGKKWHRNRKLLTPGFHFDVLKPYINVYNECVEMLMETIQYESKKKNSSIDIYGPVSLCSLDIVLRCAFSTKRNIQGKDHQDPYVATVQNINNEIVKRAFNPLLYINFIYDTFSTGKRFKELCDFSHRVADQVIEQRLNELKVNKDKASEKQKFVDFLDILLLARDEDGNGLTKEEIRDEVETFMFEGKNILIPPAFFLQRKFIVHHHILVPNNYPFRIYA